MPSAQAFNSDVRAVSPEDLDKRTEHLQKLRREAQVRQGKKGQPKRRKRPPRYRYSVRTDSGPIALRAFWSMHVEAMNWSGMGFAEYAGALGLPPPGYRQEQEMNSALFQPFRLHDMNLANRIVLSPMTRSRAGAARLANHVMAEYYTQRSSAGLLITEGTTISEEANG